MKFECQSSCKGKCCTAEFEGKTTYIFLSKYDRMRLQKFLGRPVIEYAEIKLFDSTYFTNKKSHQWVMRTEDKVCRFLKDGKCSVYEARPTQCRTFPFWPVETDFSEFCPGIGIGREYGPKEIRMIKQLQSESNEGCI